jgi:2-methylaconitate cis-trans-isomerase PrpF
MESVGGVVAETSAASGDAVTTKVADVALTYWNTPLSVPPCEVMLPTAVLVKPVPVKVTTVPTGAPTAMSAGDCEMMTGPETVTPAANAALAAEPLRTTTLSGPATAPDATVNVQTSEVPVFPAQLLIVTSEAMFVEVPW